MTYRNLDQRLNQRGRRSGMAIGVSIAATMILGIVAFVLIYSLVDPLTTEFISKDGAEVNLPAPDPLPTEEARDPTAVSTTAADVAVVPTPTIAVELLGNAEATADDRGFQAEYQFGCGGRGARWCPIGIPGRQSRHGQSTAGWATPARALAHVPDRRRGRGLDPGNRCQSCRNITMNSSPRGV
jgi:hypothetical protein